MAGEYAVRLVEDGMKLGLGTGSTAYFAIQKVAELVRQGWRLTCVPTSEETRKLAESLGIPLRTLDEVPELDLCIDGADEVNSELALIKGGGGALLREKIVAMAAKRMVVVADHRKYVNQLGSFHLPVEVVPFGAELTRNRIRELGGQAKRREQNGQAYRTDNGNLIYDCDFGIISTPNQLHQSLKLLPGVVETGLFVQIAKTAVVSDGVGVQVYGDAKGLN